MKITAIKIENVRGFQVLQRTNFSEKINIFIGANNSGKSTILNSIFYLQRLSLQKEDITIGKKSGKIQLFFTGTHPSLVNFLPNHNSILIKLESQRMNYIINDEREHTAFTRIPEREPNNLIYPYLSKRKSIEYSDFINEENTNAVTGNFTNLFSKIDRISTTQFQPGNNQYVNACKDILGFEISTLALGNGKKAVYFVHNTEHIPLTAMGEGVANIIGLITDLCIAENKIFLIEEPENDIHPKALKALLKLIIEKSETNQFFISTHSNIVMKYLGSPIDSKVFNITSDYSDESRKNLFVSKMNEVSQDPEERRRVLEDLGYDFFDFDLWKGWLFLEESSAEILIRDYFIKWYVPTLKNKIRTFSAGGTSKIVSKFDDFDKLFIFLHLEPTYKNKVWVIIDGGQKEEEIISRMREKYLKSGWEADNFSLFEKHNFEEYYPDEFSEKVGKIIEINDKQERREKKKKLLEEVKHWIESDEQSAKLKFSQSANEVINKLKLIKKVLD